MVRSRGLEPPRGFPHNDLNVARLPFRHDRPGCTAYAKRQQTATVGLAAPQLKSGHALLHINGFDVGVHVGTRSQPKIRIATKFVARFAADDWLTSY